MNGIHTKQNLDYRIVLKNDVYQKSGNPCYVAECPTLGIADDGKTASEALENIKKTITFHVECLADEGKDVPVDSMQNEMITNTRIKSPFYQPQATTV